MSFKTLTVKKGGKTVGYLQSVGCSKPKRTFTLTIAPEGSGPAATYTGAAGKC